VNSYLFAKNKLLKLPGFGFRAKKNFTLASQIDIILILPEKLRFPEGYGVAIFSG
jgi:hypothetical protein